jgi:hypothetical protein
MLGFVGCKVPSHTFIRHQYLSQEADRIIIEIDNKYNII